MNPTLTMLMVFPPYAQFISSPFLRNNVMSDLRVGGKHRQHHQHRQVLPKTCRFGMIFSRYLFAIKPYPSSVDAGPC